MSLSTLLTALNEYVGDVLVNDCDRPEPDLMFSYHGRPPDDCCTDAGTLSTFWALGSVSPGRETPCGGPPEFTIHIRYTTCWSIPKAGQSGVVVDDAQAARWNADALMLADVADCVTRSIVALLCAEGTSEDPLVAAITDELVNRSARFQDTTPILPLGGCAGVLWRLIASVRNPVVVS